MRQCTACNETKDEIEYRSKKHRRCIHCSYCDVCETIIQRGNKCILCNKTCNLCQEVKPRHQFNNKKCIECSGICIILFAKVLHKMPKLIYALYINDKLHDSYETKKDAEEALRDFHVFEQVVDQALISKRTYLIQEIKMY